MRLMPLRVWAVQVPLVVGPPFSRFAGRGDIPTFRHTRLDERHLVKSPLQKKKMFLCLFLSSLAKDGLCCEDLHVVGVP